MKVESTFESIIRKNVRFNRSTPSARMVRAMDSARLARKMHRVSLYMRCQPTETNCNFRVAD